MPPESSCGYWPRRRAASGMRTRSSHRRALARASACERPRWARGPSAICSPTVMCGVRAVRGSWKIMVIRAPRMRLNAAVGIPSSSWPRKRIEPDAWPLAARSPIAVMNVWLFPEPLSPTTPRHSPSRTVSETPLTASTTPSGESKPTRRSLISSTDGVDSVRIGPSLACMNRLQRAGLQPAARPGVHPR